MDTIPLSTQYDDENFLAPLQCRELGGTWQAALALRNFELRSNLVSPTMLFEGNEKLRLFGPYAQKPKVAVDCGGADFIMGCAHARSRDLPPGVSQ
jgi:hypothetical protein